MRDLIHKNLRYIVLSADDVQEYAWMLAAQIVAQVETFKPNYMVALWRGGAQVGIYVQEFLKRFNIEVDHVAIRTSSYTAPGEQSSTVAVHTLNYIARKVTPQDNLLIVDDIFDSGRSLDAVIQKLEQEVGGAQNMPTIKIATLFWKQSKNKTQHKADYCFQKTGIDDAWIVLPHEISDFLDPEDLLAIFGPETFKKVTLQDVSLSFSSSPGLNDQAETSSRLTKIFQQAKHCGIEIVDARHPPSESFLKHLTYVADANSDIAAIGISSLEQLITHEPVAVGIRASQHIATNDSLVYDDHSEDISRPNLCLEHQD